jgi:hypothetical protein
MVQGIDPDKVKHRTDKALEPDGETAVVQRPEGTVKILFYTCSGADRTCHTEVLPDREAACNFAREILPQAYRTAGGEEWSNRSGLGPGASVTGPTLPPAPDR